jgi:predicted DNA-binding protein with PD1-like motif
MRVPLSKKTAFMIWWLRQHNILKGRAFPRIWRQSRDFSFSISVNTRVRLPKKMTYKSRFAKVVLVALLMLLNVCSFHSNALAQGRQLGSLASSESKTMASGETRGLRVLALRLRPGQDLRQQLEAFVKEKKITAGFIITGVGSLRRASIRLADQTSAAAFDDKFEIVSLVGTLGQDGVHLHISVSDKTGKTIGGHLVEGCLIYTTAEIVIGDAGGLLFSRVQDKETGYKELWISRRRTHARIH